MEQNTKSIDSLCILMEQLKAQHMATKKSLRRYVDSELDRTFNLTFNGLMVWASKNLPCSSTAFTKMLSVIENTEVNETSPDTIPEERHEDVNALLQSENLPLMETETSSHEIIQLSDESINGSMLSSDEDEHCACTECTDNLQQPMSVEIKKSPVEAEAELCDDLSQLSNVTHISDSQPQLDDDGAQVLSDFDFEEEDLIEATNQQQVEQTSTVQEREVHFENASPSAQTSDLLTPKKKCKKYRFISLKCQYKTACKENFASRGELHVHMERVHKVLPFRCLQHRCSASFHTQNELNSHVNGKHNHFQCCKCLKVYREHSSLVRHWNLFHLEGVIACAHRKCKWRGSVQSEAKKHFQQAHVPLFACSYPDCMRMSIVYNERSSLLRHIRKEHFEMALSEQMTDPPNPEEHNNKQLESHPCPEEEINPGIDTATTSTFDSTGNRRNRVYQCKWTGCNYNSKSRLDIHLHVNEVHSRHKTVMVKHSTPVENIRTC